MLVLAVLVLSYSCKGRSVFDRFVPISLDGWSKDSAVSFSFKTGNFPLRYDMILCLRNNRHYEFSNIFLFCTIEEPHFGTSDTLQYALSDGKGKWLGRGFFDLKENLFYYKKSISLKKSTRYTIRIKHGMRREALLGIRDVGLRVVPVGN